MDKQSFKNSLVFLESSSEGFIKNLSKSRKMKEETIKKAYDRLKEFMEFSPNFESFEGLFNDNVKDDKKAIKVLLEVVFYLLKSEGDRYNELLSLADKQTRDNLKNWLNDSLKKARDDKKTKRL